MRDHAFEPAKTVAGHSVAGCSDPVALGLSLGSDHGVFGDFLLSTKFPIGDTPKNGTTQFDRCKPELLTYYLRADAIAAVWTVIEQQKNGCPRLFPQGFDTVVVDLPIYEREHLKWKRQIWALPKFAYAIVRIRDLQRDDSLPALEWETYYDVEIKNHVQHPSGFWLPGEATGKHKVRGSGWKAIYSNWQVNPDVLEEIYRIPGKSSLDD